MQGSEESNIIIAELRKIIEDADILLIPHKGGTTKLGSPKTPTKAVARYVTQRIREAASAIDDANSSL